MANAPFRTDPRLLQPEDWDALKAVEQARLARGLPGIGQEVRELITRLTPSKSEPMLIVPPEAHVIDLDAPPVLPPGWSVAPEKEQITSRVRGKFVWDKTKVALHLDPGQLGDGRLRGTKLRKRLQGRPVLPVQVGGFLFAHQDLIPDEWKERGYIHFWTVLRDSNGRLCVRCLYWCGDGWCWGHDSLGVEWDGQNPSAVPVSV